MSNKILVMGATGTIGTELVKILLDRKANFFAAICDVSRKGVFSDETVQTTLYVTVSSTA